MREWGPEWHMLQFQTTTVVSDLTTLKVCWQFTGAAIVVELSECRGYCSEKRSCNDLADAIGAGKRRICTREMQKVSRALLEGGAFETGEGCAGGRRRSRVL